MNTNTTDQPVYNVRSYLDIIRERQRLGATGGYVDLNEMMRACGRVTVVAPNEDNSHSSQQAQ